MPKTFNWVEDYVVARKILGWTDHEFWSASPRKLLAVYYTYLEFQDKINQAVVKQKPLLGKEAIKSLAGIAAGIR